MRISYLLVFTVFSCAISKTQSITEIEDYKILNMLINNDGVHILNKKQLSDKKPISYLNKYNNYFNGKGENKTSDSLINVLNGKVEWIFSKDDIQYMSKKYIEWDHTSWKRNQINKTTLVFHKKKTLPIETNFTIYKISKPMYNEDINKAMVIKIRYNGFKNTHTQILLFKKNNGSWFRAGSLFSSLY